MSEEMVILTKELQEVKALLVMLVERQQVREWYSTDQFALLAGKAEFTVREWCRHGRIHAERRLSGRGKFPAWIISHEERRRYEREGLLPFGKAQ